MKRESQRTKLDFNALKAGGFIKQVQPDLFTVRLRCPGGKLSAAQLRKAADLAEKYGKGEVHNSVRQSIEIPHIHYKDFDVITAELKEIGWSVASCGPRIRVPTACAGCSWNPNGLMDTQAMCAEVDRRYFGITTGHHKFKVTFAGCPVDCPRSRNSDLGFQGMVEPKLLQDICSGCGICASGCDENALKMVNDLPQRDLNRCNQCGDCIKMCPLEAMVESRKGWLVRVGGKQGKHPIYSWEIAQFVSNEQGLALVEKTASWYQANASGRERIGAALLRLGLPRFIDEVVKPLGLEVIGTAEERRKYRALGNMYT